MRIGGFQALTLSDYPGHVAAIVFAQGCNFRCPFCHNGSLLASDRPASELVDEAQVLGCLEARASLLDGVVLSGGEPTLQTDLVAFIQRLRAMGLKVKLDTNGSQPAVLRDLLAERLIDSMALDIKAPWAKYSQLTHTDAATEPVQQSLRLLADSDIPCAFRTTFVPTLLSQGDLDEIRSYLPEQARYTVQPFVAAQALDESLRSTVEPLADANNDVPYHLDWLSGE